jgi:hypothetical protein
MGSFPRFFGHFGAEPGLSAEYLKQNVPIVTRHVVFRIGLHFYFAAGVNRVTALSQLP